MNYNFSYINVYYINPFLFLTLLLFICFLPIKPSIEVSLTVTLITFNWFSWQLFCPGKLFCSDIFRSGMIYLLQPLLIVYQRVFNSAKRLHWLGPRCILYDWTVFTSFSNVFSKLNCTNQAACMLLIDRVKNIWPNSRRNYSVECSWTWSSFIIKLMKRYILNWLMYKK